MKNFKRETRLPGQIDDVNTGVFSNNKSVLFDGIDEYITAGNVYSFERTDSFSCSAWIKQTDYSQSIIVTNLINNSTYRGWEFGMRNDGYLYVILSHDFGTSDTIYVRTSSVVRSVGNWKHFAFTYDGSSAASGVKIYSDGSNQVLTTVTDALTDTIVTSTAFQIAKRDTLSSLLFTGYLDEISIWDDELSSAEITEIYNSKDPTDLTGHSAVSDLVGWYRMGDEDTYPTLFENINNNDGTMVNMESGDIYEDTP